MLLETVNGCDWLEGRLCVCVCVYTKCVCIHVPVHMCVIYVEKIREGSERRDGASMRGWREFGLDSAGKGKSYRLSEDMLTGYPDMGFRRASVSAQDRGREGGAGGTGIRMHASYSWEARECTTN